jgi:streptogramin lyase
VTSRTSVVLGISLLALARAASASAAPTITEYSAELSTNAAPLGMVTALDGNSWFTQNGGTAAIDKVTPSGVITSYATGGASAPREIALGPDGKLWFTESGGSAKIGTIDTQTHALSEYALVGGSNPVGIVGGPEGDVWFTESGGTAMIGRIVPSTHEMTEFAVPTANSQPAEITVGPEEDLWFTENNDPGAIGRLDPKTKVVTEYSEGLTKNAKPWGITTGAEGDIWFTEATNPGKIGRINPASGAITEFSTGLTVGTPQDIVTGSDSNLYFTESNANGAVGQITRTGAISEYTEGLTSKGKPWGISSGPDGNIWFLENANPAKVGRLTVAPSVASPSAENVSTQATRLTATVGANAQATTYYFEYGTTGLYGAQSAGETAGNSAAPVPVTTTLTKLMPGTIYHFRIVGTNATGTTYGTDSTFKTAVPPTVTEGPVTGLAAGGVTLAGTIDPQGVPTTYRFEWGTTTAYGSQLPSPDASVGSDTSSHAVSLQLTGLQPGTSYHYRIVASDCSGCAGGTTTGPDETFTAPNNGGAGTGVGEKLITGLGARAPRPGLSAPPVLGRLASVYHISGVVLLRRPGARAFSPLSGAATVPVGSLIDATHGVVSVVTALDAHGTVQSAMVWAGVFQIEQRPAGDGMTRLILRGALSPCRRGGRAHASSARTRRVRRRALWTRDEHGRYSTYGANSVATVLGTEWETVDTCAGTVTRVISGRVRVRDLHRHRAIVVRAGHSYLARF